MSVKDGKGEIIIYKTEEGLTNIEVKLVDESICYPKTNL